MLKNLALPILIFVLLGLFGLSLSKDGYSAYRSQSWPAVDGVVTQSDWSHHRGKGCNYGLLFTYNYSVSGNFYAGRNYRFGGECGSDVKQIVSTHPVGSKVHVFYKPDSPDESVVSPGDISGDTWTSLIITPLLMLLCVFLAMISFKARR
ncbi:DUF3592 domain-containing protein [Solimicrobium silvestre]|uniref:DUF3592 domain-containing protein n=1 Tax=Solimicrobium silvestre TaxID=2099400 RepID=A0A2S9H019_9BURK|nr:hypothetical protein S2091_1954 [Solimicrobium silvestre]